MTVSIILSNIFNGFRSRIFTAGILLIFAYASAVTGETRSVTYLENSDHELTIYFIDGKQPGNTMMIIGGIQGDEPGGYLAADLYADMRLEKGNLILVPRANFFSILKNQRGVEGDMNRKFDQKQTGEDYDSRIVSILHSLMEKSDVLLNLHEGSGFYDPQFISDMRNPDRFGQSIIADASVYTTPGGKKIDLESSSRRVIAEINQSIANPEHQFQFNNHNTFAEDSRHKEQRKSATFHALAMVGIPAYGIETSKSIPSTEIKVRYQTLAINAFMKEFDIIPEHPSIYLPTPELDHLVISVIGNAVPFAVKNGSSISVPAGASIHAMSIVANYARGLSLDVVGQGNSNDLNRVITIKEPTTIKVYKDSFQCGEVHIEVSPSPAKETRPPVRVSSPFRVQEFEILVSGKNMVVSEGDTLHIIKGDLLEIGDARTTDNWTSFRINFVGFVGNSTTNDAEDRGYRIDTATDLLPRFSVDNKGECYKISAMSGTRNAGSMYVKLEEPRVDYLIVEREDGLKLALSPGIVHCDKTESFKLLSVVSNVTEMPSVSTEIMNGNEQPKALIFPAQVTVDGNTVIRFRRNSGEISSIHFRTDK